MLKGLEKKIGIEVDVKPEIVTEETLAPVEPEKQAEVQAEPKKQPEVQVEPKTEKSEEKK